VNQKKSKMNKTIRLMNILSKRFGLAIVLFIILFSYQRSYAQDIYDLSRCIQTALERNYSIQVVRNNQEVSDNNFTRGNAGMLPTVSSTNRFGGTINNATQNYDDSKTTSSGVHNTTATAGVTLGMTIFDGFRVVNTYKRLGALADLGNLNTQMAIENLVAQIVSEYNYYIQQLSLYNNLAYAVSLSRERVRIDQQRYLLGSASRVEYLQSMVYLNADSSRYARQKEELMTSIVRLNELMASEDLGRQIALKDSIIKINEELLYEDLLTLTLQNNTSLQIASKNQVISEMDYNIIKSRAYPYLTMSTGYNYNYYTYGSGTMETQTINGLNYGLTLGIDIFDGFNRKREKKNAMIELENKKYKFVEVEQSIKADLYTIFYAYENNLRLLKLEEQNLAVARENLEIALERYKLGSLAGLELREVQKSLLDAEERLLSVKYQTKLAEISLLQISGKIMEYL